MTQSTPISTELITKPTREEAEEAMRVVLRYIGEDPDREGLRETPKRFVKYMSEITEQIDFNLTQFDGEEYDQMIVQAPIPFTSHCEHHLAPFIGVGAIAYIPQNKKIVGLSKLARTLERFSRGLQNQERITSTVAHYLNDQLQPLGIAVLLRARHTCMEVRGVRKQGALTTTSCLLGAFRDDEKSRREFYAIAEPALLQ